METIFNTTQEAVAWLRVNVSKECADGMENYFWQAYDKGMEIDDCVEVATRLHQYFDHNRNEVPSNFPYTTDEAMVKCFQEDGLSNLTGERRDVAEKLLLDRYWMYRDWGMNIYWAGKTATEVTEDLMDAMYPMSEEEAIQKIRDVAPNEDAAEQLIAGFHTIMAGEGRSVRGALKRAVDLWNLAGRLAGGLQSILGDQE